MRTYEQDWESIWRNSDNFKKVSEYERKKVPKDIDLGKRIAKSLYVDPDSWKADEYYLWHTKMKISFWIANGEDFFAPKNRYKDRDNSIMYPISEIVCKRIIWPAVIDWQLGLYEQMPVDDIINPKAEKTSIFIKLRMFKNYIFRPKENLKLLEYKPEDKMDLV